MRNLIAAFSITFLLATPRAGAQDAITEGEVETEVTQDEAADTSPVSFDRGFFLRVGGGLVIPVTGPVAEIGNLGGAIRLGTGYHFTENVAAIVELEAAHIPRGVDENDGYGTFSVGVGGRGSLFVLEVLHLFAEATARVTMLGTQAGTTLQLREPSTVFGTSVACGLELDLFEGVSAEGGLRADLLFSGDHWTEESATDDSGPTLVISPFFSLSYFF